MKLETFPGFTYAIHSPNGTSVSLEDGTTIAEIPSNVQTLLVAQAGKLIFSDDEARVTRCGGTTGLVYTASVEGGGGGGLNASGEPVQELSGSTLTPTHANWFTNSTYSAMTVRPAEWRNEVITCYLKTSIPVALSGVTWLYGEPAMVDTFTYVIALQQIDASTVLANLAYTLSK